ncbi:hypothetical protein RB601_004267 [Gaeumannomyces tritici]
MHLLNVKTRRLEYFIDKAPPYAILSHTWAGKELTLSDVADRRLFGLRKKRWHAKLRGFRAQAAQDGLAYIWIDTCCIDRRSSAEVNEAINSTYRWYRNADRCYAFLSDVRLPGRGLVRAAVKEQFGRSAWFSRGWTLHELIAPAEIGFFDADWRFLGNKSDLSSILQEVTGIPKAILIGRASPGRASVAQRMSWAAKRVTARPEDVAYCLLGLFDVNMPIIYGEGVEKAFFRLQTHIVLQTPDHSILAWGLGPSCAENPGGLLATSPSHFAGSERVILSSRPTPSSHPRIVGGSLQLEIPIVDSSDATTYGMLDCAVDGDDDEPRTVAIPLELTETRDLFFRPRGTVAVAMDSQTAGVGLPRPVDIRIDYGLPTPSLNLDNCVDIDEIPTDFQLTGVHPENSWAKAQRLIVPGSGTNSVLLRIHPAQPSPDLEDFVVVLRFQHLVSDIADCEALILTLPSADNATSLEALAMSLEQTDATVSCKRTPRGSVRALVVKDKGKAPGNIRVGFRLELRYEVEESGMLGEAGGACSRGNASSQASRQVDAGE